MEMADEIMSKTGISPQAAVPLSEATPDSLHSVGKVYDQDLPEMSDSQRESLIEVSLGLNVPTKKVDVDTDGDTEETANVTVGKPKVANRTTAVQAIDKTNVPRAAAKRNKKLRRFASKVPEASTVHSEMTTVGSIGINLAGAKGKPYKKGRSSWLDPISGQTVKEYKPSSKWANTIENFTCDFIDKTLGRL